MNDIECFVKEWIELDSSPEELRRFVQEWTDENKEK